jgi:hypothetical protein
MKLRFLTAVTFGLLSVGCGDNVGPDVPQLTDDGEWVVRVTFADRHVCTGIVLSPHWVLTAGHCVDEAGANDVEIEHEIFEQRTTLYDGPADLIPHPEYVGRGEIGHRWHDVGLVGLQTEIRGVPSTPRICGLTRTFALLLDGSAAPYTIGYGRLPDPDTGLCSDSLGPKKRYDGLIFRKTTGPPFENALGVDLGGRPHALCPGDSGAPFVFDLDGMPHVFGVFSGETRDRTIFHGPLAGPKVGWLEEATSARGAPLDCTEHGDDSWSCVE